MLARRTTAITVLISVAITLIVPAAASAASSLPSGAQRNHLLLLQLDDPSPLAAVWSMSTVPVGWRTSAAQAVKVAEQSPTLRALHRQMHPLTVDPEVWRAPTPYWFVMFVYRGKLVASATVSKTGKLTGVWTGPQAGATSTHGHFSRVLNAWYILVPGALMFMLAFFDPRRWRSISILDGLAVLAFLISFEFLAGGHLGPAVWLMYPPLLYMLARLLRIGFGGERQARRLAPLLGTRTLLVGLPLLLAARIVLSLVGHQEIDIGYESLTGAYRILHHLPIYWNDPNHGDTYGPITYLAYVPFQLLFPWSNSVSNNLLGAHLASIFFDLTTVVGLVLLGRRLRSGKDGTRTGLVLAWAWASCPFTTLGLIVHTNDALIAALSVYTLLLLSSPAISGALLGLAAAAKFSPAALLPLLAGPRQRGWKGTVVFIAAFAGVFVTAILAWLPPQGFGYFWQRTLGYQMTRPDVYSPWALHPSLHPLQTVLEVLAVVLALAVVVTPRERSLARICALAGAVTIAIQLPAVHWYYYYIMWFLPFALVGFLLSARVPELATEEVGEREWHVAHAPAKPALAGA